MTAGKNPSPVVDLEKVTDSKAVKLDKNEWPDELRQQAEKLMATGFNVSIWTTGTVSGGQLVNSYGQESGSRAILSGFVTEKGANGNANLGNAFFYTHGVSYGNGNGSWRVLWSHNYNHDLPGYITLVWI